MAGSRDGGMMRWQGREIADKGMAVWRGVGMAGRQDSGIERWRGGGMAGWCVGGVVR